LFSFFIYLLLFSSKTNFACVVSNYLPPPPPQIAKSLFSIFEVGLLLNRTWELLTSLICHISSYVFLTNITLCSRNKHLKIVCSSSYVTTFGPLAKPSSVPYKVKSHEKDYYLLHYLLTLCSRVLLEKVTGFRLVKKFAEFYGTRRFITDFASARVQVRGFVTRYF